MTKKKKHERDIATETDRQGVEADVEPGEETNDVPMGKTAGDGVALDAELEETRAELESVRAELEEARADKLRLLAEFKNFRQRMERDRLRIRDDAACGFFGALLPIVHDLERAREATASGARVETIAEGIDLVLRRLGDMLAREGVTKVDPLGEPFDESTMEAMGMMPSERPEGAVAQVLQKGLVLGDRLIEPARVLVSSGPQASPGTGDAE